MSKQQRHELHDEILSISSTEIRISDCARSRSRMMHTLSSSHLPLLSPRWFLLAFSSILLLLPSTKCVGASNADTDDVRRKFLRDSSNDNVLGKNEDGASNHRRLSSSPYEEAPETEEEDYESLHERLNIPLPAMGASLMGIMKEDESDIYEKGHLFAFAGTNEAMKRLADRESDDTTERRNLSSNEQRGDDAGNAQRIFAFAGTNQAMKNLAEPEDQEERAAERGRRTLTSIDEETLLDSASFGITLTQITKSRSSMLWGSDSQPNTATEAVSSDEDAQEADAELNTFGSSLHAFISSRHATPMLERSKSDLDRGRYLVGLEVRDIQSHQQVLVDYNSPNDGNSKRRPLRVKYSLAQDAGEATANQLEVLSQLMETSFATAADLWSQALRINPVPHNIIPTVETCGAATVPAFDRESGVEDADIVIYVSSNDRFCGGALMYSAVCDFDQFTRPLVGNINICAKNLPTSNSPYRILDDSTISEYAGYLTTETGRILGASTSLLRYFMDPQTMARYGTTEKTITCVDGKEEILEVPNIISQDVDKDGNYSYEIRTPGVTEIIRNHFDCMVLTGARLQQEKDSIGCFGGFLDDHLFYSEEMSRFDAASTNGPSISPLTLALLEDSSWYTANYKISSETAFGRGAGCQFARSGGCLFDETASELDNDSSAFHCSEIGEMGCDASHSHKAKCDFLDIMGVSSGTNTFCPMHTRQAIRCTDSLDSLAVQGEYFGESSKCFETDKGEPMCLRGECNALTRTIDVYYEGEMFSCHKDDQIIDTWKGVKIKCPKAAAVCPIISCPSNCSGNGVCDRDKDGKHSCICDDPFDESPGCYGEYETDELRILLRASIWFS